MQPTPHNRRATAPGPRQWAALTVLCLATLMVLLDTTIVNVVLPLIKRDLGFSQASLTWVVNAYLIGFGSLLMLAGRLGDLYGRKRIFLAGVVVFTASSALAGFAGDQATLVAARFGQGVGGALSSSVVLAIIVTEFQDSHHRHRAMGVFAFVGVAGGSAGLLAGGLVTSSLDWHWIFFINLPIGAATFLLALRIIDESPPPQRGGRLDTIGAVLLTASTALAVYAIIETSEFGWLSWHTIALAAISAALAAGFFVREGRAANPIMPLRMLAIRSLILSCFSRGTINIAMNALFFLGVLYMEGVLGYDALATGTAFLALTITVGTFSLAATPGLVRRFGPERVMLTGFGLLTAGLVAMTSTGTNTGYFPLLFVVLVTIGVGAAMTVLPILTLSLRDVPEADSGLGSGMVQVSQQLPAVFGLAVLTTLATARSDALIAEGASRGEALVAGYHLAYLVCAACVVVGAILAVLAVRAQSPPGELADPAAAELASEPSAAT